MGHAGTAAQTWVMDNIILYASQEPRITVLLQENIIVELYLKFPGKELIPITFELE